jgi:hypothetical protein
MHWVSSEWKAGAELISLRRLRSYYLITLPEELLIDFVELKGEHSGENMAEAVWRCMEFYGLSGKVKHRLCLRYLASTNVYHLSNRGHGR